MSTAIGIVNGVKHLLIKTGEKIKDFVIKSAETIKDATVTAAIATANFVEFVIDGAIYILVSSAEATGNFVVAATEVTI